MLRSITIQDNYLSRRWEELGERQDLRESLSPACRADKMSEVESPGSKIHALSRS